MACEIRTITFIDPDNTEWELPYSRGVQGLFGPPIEISSVTSPTNSGSFVTDVRHGTRELAVPVYWKDTSSSQAQLTTLRGWVAALDPMRGSGYVRVDNPDGTSRRATVRLNDGWNLEEIWTQFNEGVLVFRLDGEPYFEDENEVSATYETGSTTFSFFPIFPLSLSSSTVFATADIENDGDVAAWPVWTIEGPGSAIFINNVTTGKTIELSTTLVAGETLTIDTRPGYKTVEFNPGATNAFSDLAADASLWPLERGTNSISIEMNGSTAESNITLTYRRRWLSA